MTESAAGAGEDESPGGDWSQLRLLLHRLSNELGIILAHAELLEAKAHDDASRVRAAQVVSSALDALSTVREIRERARAGQDPPGDPSSR
jgi:hypothetical protein